MHETAQAPSLGSPCPGLARLVATRNSMRRTTRKTHRVGARTDDDLMEFGPRKISPKRLMLGAMDAFGNSPDGLLATAPSEDWAGQPKKSLTCHKSIIYKLWSQGIRRLQAAQPAEAMHADCGPKPNGVPNQSRWCMEIMVRNYGALTLSVRNGTVNGLSATRFQRSAQPNILPAQQEPVHVRAN